MFSGIVESVQPILSAEKSFANSSSQASPKHGEASSIEESFVIRIQVQRPTDFDDIKLGDSIANDGVCLTVEAFDVNWIQFALAAETLQVLQWNSFLRNPQALIGRKLNLERSMRLGDRIHGHLVTGHVDSLGQVVRSEAQGENWFLDVQVSASVLPFVWRKGCVTLNGVNLTVNQVALAADKQSAVVSVCLIPETIKRTNLTFLSVGDRLNVELDYFAKSLEKMLEARGYDSFKKN